MEFWKCFVLGSSKHCFSLFLKPSAADICSLGGSCLLRWLPSLKCSGVRGDPAASPGLLLRHVVCRNPPVPLFFGPPDLPHAQLCSRAWELWLLTQSCAARQVLPGDTKAARLPRKVQSEDGKSFQNQKYFHQTYWFWHITINLLPIPA